MNLNNTDLLRSKLRHYEAQPPEHLLDDVLKEMEKRGLKAAKPAEHHRRAIAAGAVGVAVAAVVVALMLLRPVAQINQRGNSGAAVSNRPVASTPSGDNVPFVSAVGNTVKEQQEQTSVVQHLIADITDGIEEILSPATTDTVFSNPASTGKEQKKESKPAPFTPNVPRRNPHEQYAQVYHPIHHGRSHTSGFSLGMFYGGAGSSSMSTPGVVMEAANPIGGSNGIPDTNEPVVPEQTTVKEHTSYKQPVRMGLSVGIPLGRHWRLNTGVNYSYLSSETTGTSVNLRNTTEQKLHYVGIPVTVSRSIVSSRNFSVYATAGAEMEKLVSGKRTTFTEQTTTSAPTKETVKEDRPQFSVNAAIGAEYRFRNDIGVYVEPGVSRYINNGSNIDNIYKDKPTNFSLNVGIRINVNNKK